MENMNNNVDKQTYMYGDNMNNNVDKQTGIKTT
jgi:hypothetical protein